MCCHWCRAGYTYRGKKGDGLQVFLVPVPRFSATSVATPAGRLIPGDSKDAGGELSCFIETV